MLHGKPNVTRARKMLAHLRFHGEHNLFVPGVRKAPAGTDKTRMLMAQIFVANMKEFDGMNKAWDAWVAEGNAPPRATIEARLASADYKVEIVVTAAV